MPGISLCYNRLKRLSFSALNARQNSRDSSVSIVTELQTVRSSNQGGISERGQLFIYSQKRQN